MSILKVNDQLATTSHGQESDSSVTFYAVSELPLTITEVLDKSRYYFPGEDIVFTVTLALKPSDPQHPEYVTTLDAIKVEDTIPDVVVFDVSSVTITGGATTPTPTVTGQALTIDGIQLDATHTSATITISGKIKNTF